MVGDTDGAHATSRQEGRWGRRLEAVVTGVVASIIYSFIQYARRWLPRSWPSWLHVHWLPHGATLWETVKWPLLGTLLFATLTGVGAVIETWKDERSSPLGELLLELSALFVFVIVFFFLFYLYLEFDVLTIINMVLGRPLLQVG